MLKGADEKRNNALYFSYKLCSAFAQFIVFNAVFIVCQISMQFNQDYISVTTPVAL